MAEWKVRQQQAQGKILYITPHKDIQEQIVMVPIERAMTLVGCIAVAIVLVAFITCIVFNIGRSLGKW